MPFFDFLCQSCEEVTEFRLESSSETPVVCPKCGKNSLTKMISRGITGIVKGSKTPCPNRKTTKKEEPKTEEKVRPWWRKSDKINTDILKNPRRYISTGQTE